MSRSRVVSIPTTFPAIVLGYVSESMAIIDLVRCLMSEADFTALRDAPLTTGYISRSRSTNPEHAISATKKKSLSKMEKKLLSTRLDPLPPTIGQRSLSSIKRKQATTSSVVKNSAQTTKHGLTLLTIPLELRLMVYDYMYPPGSIVHVVDMVSFEIRFRHSLARTINGRQLSERFIELVRKRKKGSIFRAVRCTRSHMTLGVNCRCHPHKLLGGFLDPAENIDTSLAVLRTCRQVYRECLPIAYSNAIFSFIEPADNMLTSPALFFRTIKTAADHIQHVGLSLVGWTVITHRNWQILQGGSSSHL